MIVLGKDERLRRRYPGKLKSYGKGMMYLTSKRICFEHEKHGLCLDLKFTHLCSWSYKNRSLTIRWSELVEQTRDNTCPIPEFNCEIELDKKRSDGRSIDVVEAYYAIFYAYCNFWKYGPKSIGWRVDENGQVWNHLQANQKEPFKGTEADQWSEYMWGIIQNQMLYNIHAGHPLLTVSKDGKEEDFLNTYPYPGGDTLLEQEINAMLDRRILAGWDRKFSKLYGFSEKAEVEDFDPVSEIKKYLVNAENGLVNIKNEIQQYEKENNTKELERVRPASPPHYGPSYFSGGTVYDFLESQKDCMTVIRRAAEIICNSNRQFRNYQDYLNYRILLTGDLLEKHRQGIDIFNYNPTVETYPDPRPTKLKQLEQYSQRLVEVV